MDRNYLHSAVDHLRTRGIHFAPGLTDRQLATVESMHGFRFPPDLRAFLEYALPTGERFPDWRDPESMLIRNALEWPSEGICFDIEHNGFWLAEWGQRPDSLEMAWGRAREAVRAAPFLIPIYAHRYIPASPQEPGNPVFSVYQTDIIHYGLDLPSYLLAEFGVPDPFPLPSEPRKIEFWSELVRLNG